MNKRKQKHPLAALRKIAGLAQKDVANLLGVSTAMIQSIELGRRGLTDASARQLTKQLGVNYKWLTTGRPGSSPLTKNGQPYTREYYEQKIAPAAWLPIYNSDIVRIRYRVIEHIGRLLAVYLSAYRANDIFKCTATVQKRLDGLEKQYGNSTALKKVVDATGPEIKRLYPNLTPLVNQFFKELYRECERKVKEHEKSQMHVASRKRRKS